MDTNEADAPNELASAVQKLSERLSVSVKMLNVSILTAAIVRAANRPHSVAEVLKLRDDIENAMNPRPKNVEYVEWAKTSQDRLASRHE
jgi:hypothetical protein